MERKGIEKPMQALERARLYRFASLYCPNAVTKPVGLHRTSLAVALLFGDGSSCSVVAARRRTLRSIRSIRSPCRSPAANNEPQTAAKHEFREHAYQLFHPGGVRLSRS